MSLFKLLNSPTIVEALQKSGQFLSIPPEILGATNDEHYLPDAVRTRINSTFKKSGKIDPKQLKMLLENRNLDVLSGLVSQRQDLDYDTLKHIVNTPESIKAGETRRRTKRSDLQKAVFERMRMSRHDFADDMISNGTTQGIRRMIGQVGDRVSGQHLFQAITTRKDLDKETLLSIVKHKSFDAGHLAELYKHEDPEVVKAALERVGRDGYQSQPERISQYVDDLMRNGSPAMKAALLETGYNSTIAKALNSTHIDAALAAEDPETRSAALQHISTPEQMKYAIANVLPRATNLRGDIGALVRDSHKDIMDGGDLSAIVNHALEKDPEALGDYHLRGSHLDKIPEESIQKILNHPGIPQLKDDYLRAQDSEATHRLVLQGSPHPDAINKLFKVAKTPELIQDTWDKFKNRPADDNYHNNLMRGTTISDLFKNPATPTHLFWDAHNNATAGGVFRDGHAKAIAENPNAPADLIDKLQEHEDPNMRAVMAFAHAPTSDQILKGIKDKHKDVRAVWIKHAADKFEDQHFMELLKDRSPKNRAEVAKNPKLSEATLRHVLTKDKSEDVRSAALKNPSITGPLLDIASRDPNPDVKRAVLEHPLAPASVIENAASGPVDVDLARTLAKKPMSTAAVENIYGQLKGKLATAPASDHYRSDPLRETLGYYALKHPEGKLLSDLAKTPDEGLHQQVLSAGRDNGRLTAEDLAHMYTHAENSNKHDSSTRLIAKHPNVSEGIIHRMLNSANQEVRGVALAGIKDPKKLEEMARTSDSNHFLSSLAGNAHLDDKTFQAILANKATGASAVQQLLGNPSLKFLTPQHIEAAYNWGNQDHHSDDHHVTRARIAAVQHPLASEALLSRAVKDQDSGVVESAGKGLSHHNPDMYNSAIGGEEIGIHPHVEKLKHLKGKIDEAGGVVHKNDLPNKGQGIDGKLFDGKGQLTSAAIDKHIDSLPKNKFNVSYSQWRGAQVHDNNASGPQKVVQLNMTNDHIKQLKDEGLWDTFKKMHAMSVRSGHPVRNHTLGWARIDESHPEHWHVDEIQSDLGQGTVRQIERAKEQGQMGSAEADKYTDHLKKMIKIFSGSFKNINHAIFGAVHQLGRQKGIKSTSMDKLEDQASQSGMRDKALPGHMQHTYKQLPEDHGYTEAPKKEVMPNTKAEEPTVNARKLIKSLEQLKDLLERLK